MECGFSFTRVESLERTQPQDYRFELNAMEFFDFARLYRAMTRENQISKHLVSETDWNGGKTAHSERQSARFRHQIPDYERKFLHDFLIEQFATNLEGKFPSSTHSLEPRAPQHECTTSDHLQLVGNDKN
jgi:hypothetical protein